MKRPRAVAVLLACSLFVGELGGTGLQVSATEYDTINEIAEFETTQEQEQEELETQQEVEQQESEEQEEQEIETSQQEIQQEVETEQEEEVLQEGLDIVEVTEEPEILGKGYTFSDGVMTLNGQIDFDEFYEFPDKAKVKEVVAVKGAVLPECCWSLFFAYTNCTKIDLSKADGSKVKQAEYMFKGCTSVKEIKLCKMSNLTDMTEMFYGCYVLESLNIDALKTASVTSMNHTFHQCKSLKTLDVSGFDTGKVTDMSGMFYYCSALETLDVSHFNTAKVENMQDMFMDCAGLTKLDVSNFNTSNVTDMRSMFCGTNVESLELGNFDTTNVTDMSGMFARSGLISLDLRSFNTSKVVTMDHLFSASNKIKFVDMSSFDMTNVTDTYWMFDWSYPETLILGKGFKNVNSEMHLVGGDYGWCRGDSDGKRISGDEYYAEFSNTGYAVYHRIYKVTGKVNVTGDYVIGSIKKTNLEWDYTNPVYQWYRGGEKIKGATKSTYKLTKDDVGYLVGCEVSSSDVWLIGSIKEYGLQDIIKLDPPAAPTGLKAVLPSVKGKNDGKITGVTTAMEFRKQDGTYSDCTSTTITGLEPGTYFVRLKETDTAYAGEAAEVIVPEGNEALTGTVTISGKLKYGQTLSAKVANSNATQFTYQWKRGKTIIDGATAAKYKIVKEDIGQVLTCVVKDAEGKTVKSISGKTTDKIAKMDAPAAPVGLTSTAPSVKGASDGKISGVKTTMEYAAKSDFSDAKACTSTSITGLKAGTYYVRVKETTTTLAGKAAKVTVAQGKEALTGTVTISGKLKYGQTLSAKVANSNATQFTYQWKRGKTIIDGATAAKYKIVKEDIGQVLTCVVKDAEGKTVKSISGKTTDKIAKMDAPAAPSDLKAKAPSKKGTSDGKITGVKTTMEYATKSDFSDAKACTSTSITGLKAGTYYVRVKETETTLPGKTATVKVPQGAAPTPTPTPMPTPTPTPSKKVTKVYSDVKEGEWYVSAIQFVYDHNIMSGVDEKNFAPLNKLTRAQFVTTLHNLEGKPSAKYKRVFTDVMKGQWYTDPVMWAFSNNITNGISDSEFGIEVKITREQLATMLYNYATFKKYNLKYNNKALDNFPDSSQIADWAQTPMKWAVSKGIMSGKTDSKGGVILDPKGEATRAECAQMIKNLYDHVNQK